MRAWDLARAAAASSGVELRPLETLEHADGVIAVMSATWGEFQLIPRELIRALQESGNVPYGAFVGDELVGYVLGWAGVDRDGLHVHSHMLAVLPDLQSRGIGHALKLAQRAQGLDQGIHVARWTFDPLVSRNAYFNLVKLGAGADRFHRNFYGQMDDVLNRGERTDRLVVRWDLDAEPGRAPVEEPGAVIVLDCEGPDIVPAPGAVTKPEGAPAVVRIPRDHPSLRETDPDLARAWRDAVADALDACFGAGLSVVGWAPEGGYVFS
jgi:predicted GNAT superfamily acetyltransferase